MKYFGEDEKSSESDDKDSYEQRFILEECLNLNEKLNEKRELYFEQVFIPYGMHNENFIKVSAM